MRVTTKAVYDMKSGALLEWEGFDYDGPVALLGGGPSSQQKDAAAQQGQLSQFEMQQARDKSAREQEQYDAIKPYAMDRLNNGLPFYGDLTDFSRGTTAQAFAPMRAQIARRTSQYGSMPSGYRDAQYGNLDQAQGEAFDGNLRDNMLMNEQSKSEAARLLTGQQQIANPLGWAGSAGSTNSSIMNAPLQSPSLAGLIGGVAGGAISKIPF